MSIIVMLGTPFYLDYQTRAKIGAEIGQMAPVKQAITGHFHIEGSWPKNNGEAGAREPGYYKGKYIESIEVSDSPQPGSLHVIYNTSSLPSLTGANSLVFHPETSVNGKIIAWHCITDGFVEKLIPVQCRT